MAAVNTKIFKKFRQLTVRQEGDGDENKADVREDEEQSVKFQEIIDLLVAAGYFRARIKGLSSFDKVVGGMTWCIDSCNVDIDVDLLFQENSTIGQKISLTEKIVAVLQKMKCPHRIEPHQIQGLDFIHIFPVVQWLVKRSMEFRQEMAEYMRTYAVNQFNKTFPESSRVDANPRDVIRNINAAIDSYKPRRFYKRKTELPDDIKSRVQITLLEYGLYGLRNRTNKKLSEGDSMEDDEQELQIQQILDNMIVSEEISSDFNLLTEEERKELVKHYVELHQEIGEGSAKTIEQKQRQALEQKKIFYNKQINKLNAEKETLLDEISANEKLIEEIRNKQSEAARNLKEVEKNVDEMDGDAKCVEELVKSSDNLRQRESQFKEQCKKELAELQAKIEEARAVVPDEGDDTLNEELESELEKLRTIRLHLAKKNRVISLLQRQLDEVPSRPELAQYQRRFLELYNQVAAKHKETKQYFTLYNTLEDTKLYMKKELSLLNSISDNYPEALQSNASRDEFLNQFESIVESVKQSKIKIEQRLAEEKFKRDQLSGKLQGLVELQRRYVAAVRELSVECKRYEAFSTQQKV